MFKVDAEIEFAKAQIEDRASRAAPDASSKTGFGHDHPQLKAPATKVAEL